MNSSELLVILIVALIAFGPSKLPMLATHLGMLFRKVNQMKEYAAVLWQEQLKNIQLYDNNKKAEQADKQYQGIEAVDTDSSRPHFSRKEV